MLPYGDSLIGQRRFGAVTWLIAALTILHGFSFISDYYRAWILAHLSFVPLVFSIAPWSRFHTLGTATFLHADTFHLLGNCLFLWVFGRSLEALFGSMTFAAVFPLLGITGFISEWALNPDSERPIIGASGAIAALMGAYLTLFPRAKVKMVFVNVPLFKRFSLPAWAFLFYWIILQVLSVALGSGSSDHVAYAVHVGAFMAGVIAAMAWKVTFPLADDKLAEFNPPTCSHLSIDSATKL